MHCTIGVHLGSISGILCQHQEVAVAINLATLSSKLVQFHPRERAVLTIWQEPKAEAQSCMLRFQHPAAAARGPLQAGKGGVHKLRLESCGSLRQQPLCFVVHVIPPGTPLLQDQDGFDECTGRPIVPAT